MDSKTRSKLRSMSNAIKESVIIGKDGITENVKKQIEDNLLCRELVKIKLLETCEYSADEAKELLATAMRAEAVSAIGRKVILYRKSYRKDIKHIEL